MATFVLDNAFLEFNSVDLSDHVVSVTVNGQTDEQEDTAMSVDWRSYLPGLNNWNVSVEFREDFASSSVAATLWSAWSGRTSATIAVRPDAGATASTNPKYSGTAFLSTMPPLAGSLGQTANKSVTFRGSGTLSQATS